MTGTTPPRLLRQRRFVPAHPRRRSRGSPAPLLALPPRVRPERRAVRAARPSLAPTELAVRDGGPVKSQVSQRDSLGARPVTGISKTRWWSCLVPYLALPLGGELQELERSRLVGLLVVGKDHVVVCTQRKRTGQPDTITKEWEGQMPDGRTFLHHRSVALDLAHLLDDARHHAFDLGERCRVTVSGLERLPCFEQDDSLMMSGGRRASRVESATGTSATRGGGGEGKRAQY